MRRTFAGVILAMLVGSAAAAIAAEPAEQAAEAEHEVEHDEGVPPINWFSWHKGKNVYGAKLDTNDPHAEPMAPALVFALVNFAIFAGVLVWKAGPIVRGYTRERHDTIRDALEEGARLREEAQVKLADYSKRIAGVEAEVDQLIADIRATAEAERAKILAQAETQAAALRTEADQRIAAEIVQARLELHREVMVQALAIAEKLIRDKASPADQQKLFDGFVADLDATAKEVRS